ncbi:MAG: chorismate mutase, partial [Firmicutes bacterium]|nr:chorismate mutase [Bacillota bacterium]
MDISELRSTIDATDDEILRLFLRRMETVGEVAAQKRESGGPILQPEREREILLRVSKAAPEGLAPYARRLFETLFDLSRAYQGQLLRTKEAPLTAQIRAALDSTPQIFPESARVACQGVVGAYSQLACDKLFPLAEILYFKNWEGVMNAVERGLCDYGVLPIENSTHGVVDEVYDLMRAHNVYIVRGTRLQISHALLAKPGAAFSDIREIYSHEQALGQCAVFLQKHPEIKVTVCENTATAARLVSQNERRDVASISSPECARLYGLSTLVERVQSEETNYTRFICVSRKMEIYPGANKISFLA